MKKYRLLKEIASPNLRASIPVGAIFEDDGLGHIVGKCEWRIGNGDINVRVDHISPDWFEEIEEKEFTKSDMIEFAEYSGASLCTGYSEDLECWLKERKSA